MPNYAQQRKIFATKHVCQLEPLDSRRELPAVAPFAPFRKRFIYNLRGWMTASRWNPSCKEYFRSNCALYNERRRQLGNKKYRGTIHPLSRFAMLRQMFMSVMWIVIFVTEPLFRAFFNDFIEDTNLFVTNLTVVIFNVVFLMDIILQFFIGFAVQRTKEIVLDRGRIARNYLTGFFIFDLIPIIYGLVYFLNDLVGIENYGQVAPTVNVWMVIAQLYVLRFVRIHTMVVYFKNMLLFFTVHESIVRCVTIALVIILMIHWCSCFLFVVPLISHYMGYEFSHSYVLSSVLGTNRKVYNLYIESLLNTVCHFFGAGKANISTDNPFEQTMLALILIWGLTCYIYATAIILQLFGTINVSETKYELLIYQLKEYMVTKKLPQPLRKRLLIYYEYRFQKQFFVEHLILHSLSEHLRCEVLLHSCKQLINKVKIFQGAPKEVIGALVALLKHEIFLPNDHIVKRDSINQNVYFISFGTVAVYLPDGREVYHLEDGHHFGEVEVVLQDQEFLITVVAIEITEVFYLNKKDFWYIMTTHPEIADSLEKTALAKLMNYKDLLMKSVEDIIDSGDILMELRKGLILDSGRKRT